MSIADTTENAILTLIFKSRVMEARERELRGLYGRRALR